MNNSNPNQTIAQLQELGLISPSSAIDSLNIVSEVDNHNRTPWFIHLFFGFSGVLSSIFLVGSLTLILYQADIFDSSILQLVIGIILSTAAFALFKNKKSRDNTFWNSLAFAISIAGQLYVAFALFGSDIKTPLDTGLLLLVQLVMTVIIPNFIYRLLSSTVALGCIIYILGHYQIFEINLGLLALVMVVANLQRTAILQRLPAKWRAAAIDISRALTYASALLLIIFSVYIVNAEYTRDFVSNVFVYNYILAQGLLMLASLYAAYLILKRYNIALFSKPSLIIMGAIIVLGVISVYAAGLLATCLIIVIAMTNSQRLLLGLGVLALVGYIFWYYYQLDTSLLVKSGSMLIIGIVMLLMRWLLVSRYFTDDKQRINATDNKGLQS